MSFGSPFLGKQTQKGPLQHKHTPHRLRRELSETPPRLLATQEASRLALIDAHGNVEQAIDRSARAMPSALGRLRVFNSYLDFHSEGYVLGQPSNMESTRAHSGPPLFAFAEEYESIFAWF